MLFSMHSGCLSSGGVVSLQEHSGERGVLFCTELSELDSVLSVKNRLATTVSFLLRQFMKDSAVNSQSPA